MSSNSPSGGMKLMVRSTSNWVNRTHWWNWQSSNSTALSPALPRSLRRLLASINVSQCIGTHLFSKTILSLRPNLHSGSPDRYALINICPSTSARRTVPREPIEIEFESDDGSRVADRTFWTHHYINDLDNVYECLVLAIFHTRTSPIHASCSLGSYLGWVFSLQYV